MKYKVGDEVLVKAKISEINEDVFPNMPYCVMIRSTKDWNGVVTESGRTIEIAEDAVADMTAEEAWEIAKKIFADFENSELDEIFGRKWSFQNLMELTPQEAKAKIEAWEEANKIKVGDEVALISSPDNNDFKFFVTYINDDGHISGFSGFDGDVFCDRDIKQYKKTGRHIDIDGMLRKIGGDE